LALPASMSSLRNTVPPNIQTTSPTPMN